jgi:hypothetical protein
MARNNNFIVERYLDQVKVIAALATTLLITPNLFLTLLEKADIRAQIEAAIPAWRLLLLFTDIMFLLSILSTYFIYSSIVGSLLGNETNVIDRPFTRAVSILQFIFLVLGCIGLLFIFNYSL